MSLKRISETRVGDPDGSLSGREMLRGKALLPFATAAADCPALSPRGASASAESVATTEP
jgi:hypothetical protein